MTDPRPALHAAILADPGDLAARHAYADLLEERGEDTADLRAWIAAGCPGSVYGSGSGYDDDYGHGSGYSSGSGDGDGYGDGYGDG